MHLIPSNWETKRLFVRDATVETDLKHLQSLWESTAYIGEFDGRPERKEEDIYIDLTEGDLPPGGSKDNFKLQPFFSKETSEMIGFVTLYHGYPDDKTLWVPFFYVSRDHQGRGYGHEMIQQLAAEAANAGFERAMLTVALKNWTAIRFWTKEGFDKITGVYGDKNYGTHCFAHLGLEKTLV